MKYNITDDFFPYFVVMTIIHVIAFDRIKFNNKIGKNIFQCGKD